MGPDRSAVSTGGEHPPGRGPVWTEGADHDQFAAPLTRNSSGCRRGAARHRPVARLTGIAFVVFFLGGVVASNAPSDNASAASWMAAYTGGGRQFSHEASGVLLVLAALSLMSFLVTAWSRVGRLRPEGSHSRCRWRRRASQRRASPSVVC